MEDPWQREDPVGHTQLKTGPINVGHLQMDGFGEAKTAAKDRHEKDSREGIALGADGDEPLDLFGAEHTGRLDATGRTLDPDEEGLDVLAQQPAVERAKGIDGEIDGGRGKLALGDEVE